MDNESARKKKDGGVGVGGKGPRKQAPGGRKRGYIQEYKWWYQIFFFEERGKNGIQVIQVQI